MLADRVRRHLTELAAQGRSVTYRVLAQQLDLEPPNTIQQVTRALEQLMQEDAAADHPLIAALVVSKAAGGIPRQGFFECAQRIGCFQGDAFGAEAISFHEAEFKRAVAYWRSTALQ
ncbi:MAG: hypothetical protein HOH68_01565 [Rhodobacteraceae bacterium]|jgi:hypothetical protein|nr:conserved hypothetical protein [Rhodobacteraceae bacterium HTCC2083]MBT5821004.1 hypothetical protein [Paracoccaceae bacterium]HCW82722.1 hypothetical protein [Paracoccaceae bacterium]